MMRDLDAAKILAALLKTLKATNPTFADDFKKNLSTLNKDDLAEALEIIRKTDGRNPRRSSRAWVDQEAQEELNDGQLPVF